MGIRIPNTVLDQIFDHVQEGFPYECCGIFGGDAADNVVRQATRAGNLNQDRKHDRYEMNPADQLKSEKAFAAAGQEILGYYHSHPDHPARPSETDRVNAWPGYSYMILSVIDGKVAKFTSWRLNEKTEQFEQEDIFIEKADKKQPTKQGVKK